MLEMEMTIEPKTEKRKPGRPSTNDTRRKEILEKSTTCFIKFGFNKTTLDEIGEAIGFNKAALYYYFKNKEELFVQVVNNQLTIGLNKLQQDISDMPDSEAKILKYFWNRTQVYTTIIKLTSLSSENILDLNSTFEEIYAPYKKAEIRYVKDILMAINKNGKSSAECESFTELLFDVVHSLTIAGLLVRNISEESSILELHNQKKETVIKHLLKSFNG